MLIWSCSPKTKKPLMCSISLMSSPPCIKISELSLSIESLPQFCMVLMSKKYSTWSWKKQWLYNLAIRACGAPKSVKPLDAFLSTFIYDLSSTLFNVFPYHSTGRSTAEDDFLLMYWKCSFLRFVNKIMGEPRMCRADFELFPLRCLNPSYHVWINDRFSCSTRSSPYKNVFNETFTLHATKNTLCEL